MKLSSFRSLFPILFAKMSNFCPFLIRFLSFLLILGAFGCFYFLEFFFFLGLVSGSIDDSIEFSTIEGVALGKGETSRSSGAGDTAGDTLYSLGGLS